jgi:hypothetical protein
MWIEIHNHNTDRITAVMVPEGNEQPGDLFPVQPTILCGWPSCPWLKPDRLIRINRTTDYNEAVKTMEERPR